MKGDQRRLVSEGMVLKGGLEHFDYVLRPEAPLAHALAAKLGLDFTDCDRRAVEELWLQVR